MQGRLFHGPSINPFAWVPCPVCNGEGGTAHPVRGVVCPTSGRAHARQDAPTPGDEWGPHRPDRR